jgi:hypothetical protein
VVIPAARSARSDCVFCSRICTLWPRRLRTMPCIRPVLEPPTCGRISRSEELRVHTYDYDVPVVHCGGKRLSHRGGSEVARLVFVLGEVWGSRTKNFKFL